MGADVFSLSLFSSLLNESPLNIALSLSHGCRL
jgi:hypothetical protein